MLAKFLTEDHRDCDDQFARAEAAASDGDVAAARAAFAEFEANLAHHLEMEERVLFPEFEQATGMHGVGPTAVMRMEHEQMRSLLGQMQGALAAEDLDSFLGAGETLNVLIQQHNMKEEHMLYPMAEQALAASAGPLLERMQAL
ncbi:MAG: hemerythrin domain-containing protein [Xanthomonadales bacterium]|nr:hemerythrin domain-containing protein [Xanthomonadales bacterium]